MENKKRSNHFPDEAVDRGFPDHISQHGDAYYGDGTVLKASGEMQNKDIGVPGSELRPTPALDADLINRKDAIAAVEEILIGNRGAFTLSGYVTDRLRLVPARQREGGSVSTTEGATVPSQPSPESAAQEMKSACIAKVREMARRMRAQSEGFQQDGNQEAAGSRMQDTHTLEYAAEQLESLTPVSESLTPDVQGKLAAAIRRVLNKLDDPHLSVTAVDADALREALALLDGQNQDQKE